MATSKAPLRILSRLATTSQPLKRSATQVRYLDRPPSWVCRRCVATGRSRKPLYLHAEDGYNQKSWVSEREYFAERHIGPSEGETSEMLQSLQPEVSNMDDFIGKTITADIRSNQFLQLDKNGRYPLPPEGAREKDIHAYMSELARMNKTGTFYIGCGYSDTIVPPVIQRNILENPAWYTSYTPYQAEISQGRLE